MKHISQKNVSVLYKVLYIKTQATQNSHSIGKTFQSLISCSIKISPSLYTTFIQCQLPETVFNYACFHQVIAMCLVEQLHTDRGIMIFKDMWKNQHFQVSNFKHMLKRQGDKHPGFISCKLQIFFCFLLFPFLSSHAEGQFFKEV